MTHVDLFSGIGGFALAAQWAGFKTVCFSEVEPYAIKVLKRHWPDVPNVGDITTADFRQYTGATLLTGGFPCQPWSRAGLQKGTDDDRNLWPSMLQAIRTIRPSWVVGENVDGIIGLEFCEMLTDLEGAGYIAQPVTIPACAVGAGIERERVWILASSNEEHGCKRLGHCKKNRDTPLA